MFHSKPHFYSESGFCVIFAVPPSLKYNVIYAVSSSNEVFNVALRRKCLPTSKLKVCDTVYLHFETNQIGL